MSLRLLKALISIAAALWCLPAAAQPDGCPDIFEAQNMLALCASQAAKGQCTEATASCAASEQACPALPEGASKRARALGKCGLDGVPGGANGDACRQSRDCQRGLVCAARACAPAPKSREEILELQISARRIAALSPCDARDLLEVACGISIRTEHSDLQGRIQQDLGPARALCPSHAGPLCDGAVAPLGPRVEIPGGPFARGSEPDDAARGIALCRNTYSNPINCNDAWFAREQPRKTIELPPFAIDRYEVTNARYQNCVKAGDCAAIDRLSCALFDAETASWTEGGPAHPDLLKSNHPVVCATWSEAAAFCTWAGGRLPTEAEWEKAARGDNDDREFPWGDDWRPAGLNWGETGGFGSKDGFETTSPVGAFAGNVSPFGAFDMAGNVWEWTADGYRNDFYASAPDRAPRNDVDTGSRVLRGGSWSFGGHGARTSYRYHSEPDSRDDAVGFRCAYDAQ